MIAVLIVAVLALGALVYVVAPLRTAPAKRAAPNLPMDAAIRKRRALEAILDLEADLASGKLDPEDFSAYRDAYAREALDAMRELDIAETSATDSELETEIAAARTRLR